jgi:MSHA pilin protein MshC
MKNIAERNDPAAFCAGAMAPPAGSRRSAAVRNGRVEGFTLIELIAVIVIIALIAAVGTPMFFNVGAFRESGFLDETRAAVRYAQKLAVASGCAVQVQVAGNGYTLSQVPSGVYTATNPATCNTPPYSVTVPDPSNAGNGFTRSAPPGVVLNAVPATFVFCPLGDTAAGACTGNYANVNVTLTVNGQTISVTGGTGFVQ